MPPRDEIGRWEIRKDAVQETAEATATAVGTVTTIVATAVRDVARALGGYATDIFEIRQGVRRARAEESAIPAGVGAAGVDPDDAPEADDTNDADEPD